MDPNDSLANSESEEEEDSMEASESVERENSMGASESEEQEESIEASESEEENFEDPCPELIYSHVESKFSDLAYAIFTLKSMELHDINHRFKVISEERLEAEKALNLQSKTINDNRQAIAVFENWLRDYREKNRHEKNLDYLPIETIEAFRPLAQNYGIFMYDDFYKKYKAGNGDYTTLRTAETAMDCWGTDTWDILRNEWLESIINNMRSKNIGWYDWYTADWCQDNKGLPSREHTRCILLGYSPDPEKLEELIPKMAKRFRRLDENESDDDDDVERREKKLTNDEAERRKKNVEAQNGSNDYEFVKKEKEERHVHSIECERHDNETDAIRTLKKLYSRDVTYQFQLIELYHCRAKENLKENEKCMTQIADSIKQFDTFLEYFRETNGKETNKPYLPIETIEAFRPLAHSYGLYAYQCFYENYKKVNGDFIALRAATTDNCKCIGAEYNWNVRRNDWLQELERHDNVSRDYLYVTEDNVYKGFPTKAHVRLILLGYSPDAKKLQKLIPKIAGKFQLLEKKENCVDSAYSAVALVHTYNKWGLETNSPWKALKILDNALSENCRRDIDFQFEMITYYRECAVKLLKNQEYYVRRNLKTVADFDEWFRNYAAKNREKELLPYLPLETVEAFRPLGRRYGIAKDEFYEVYKAVYGNYKALRGLKIKPKNYRDETTWDIWRNDCLDHIIGKLDSNKRRNVVWYEVENSVGLVPSKEHVQCILLGYSPKPECLTTLIPRISEICAQKKRVRETTPEAHCSRNDAATKKMKTSPTSD